MNPDPVAKAMRSPSAQRKAQTKRTATGQPCHSYRSLLAELATQTRDTTRLAGLDLDVWQATGRLTRDPELRYLPDGTPVCQIRIAVEGMGRGGRDETGYINATQFGDPGLAAAKVLATGWLVAVEGRLEYHEWEHDGKTRHDYQVIGRIEFLAAPRNGNSASD